MTVHEMTTEAQKPVASHSEDALLQSSPTSNIFVIDIPASISEAQNSLSDNPRRQILSCAPLKIPYPSENPKTERSRQRLLAQWSKADLARHEEYAELISHALLSLKDGNLLDRFCRDRRVLTVLNDEGESRKRKAPATKRIGSDESLQGVVSNVFPERVLAVDDMLRDLARGPLRFSGRHVHDHVVRSETGSKHTVKSHSRFKSNQMSDMRRISMSNLIFNLPPHSAALNAVIASTPDNLTALLSFTPDTCGRFPLILLDPPWPNRSARRKQSYQTYGKDKKHGSLEELYELLINIHLDQNLTEDGHMAVWITNKPSVRKLVLDLFDSLNVEPREEWIWAKVTESGEPMSDLRRHWRQPWEILLIGRRRPELAEPATASKVSRRVIFGVPDLHSRKPCLKQLFHRLLLKPNLRTDSRPIPVLELFARYMVSGWFSWGDEALKFQWQGWWQDEECTIKLISTT